MADDFPVPHPDLPVRPSADGPAERLGRLLRELASLENEVERLADGIEALRLAWAREAAPFLAAIGESRQALLDRLEAALPGGKRERRLREKGARLLWRMALALEEDFGRDTGSQRARWPEGEPKRDEAAPQLPPDGPEAPPRPSRSRRFDPEALSRGLYRALARDLHPDKARDPREQERRLGPMQELVRAGREQDLPTLLRLLAEHGGERARAELGAAALETGLVELERRRRELRARRQALRHGDPPPGCVDWRVLLENPGQAELARRRLKEGFREERDDLERWVREWDDPEAVLAWLREVEEDVSVEI